MTLIGSASVGTLEQFRAFYQPGDAERRLPGGRTLLSESLGNADPVNRFEIASFLLDEGADAAWKDSRYGTSLVHILLGKINNERPPDSDRLLIARILDGGADLNAVDRRFGTAVQCLVDRANDGETNTSPLYGTFFSRPDLDLFKVGSYGETSYQSARSSRESRPLLWQRVVLYVADHALEIPRSELEE